MPVLKLLDFVSCRTFLFFTWCDVICDHTEKCNECDVTRKNVIAAKGSTLICVLCPDFCGTVSVKLLANLVPRLFSALPPVLSADRMERRNEPGYKVGFCRRDVRI